MSRVGLFRVCIWFCSTYQIIRPSRALFLYFFGFLRPTGQTGDSGQAIVPEGVCFCLFYWDLLVNLLCLVQNCTIGHCGSFGPFVLAWIDFLDPP